MSAATVSKVTVIGGGFSGLTLAYYLAKAGVPVELFEKSDRLGGLISTLKFDWGYVETAASGLIGSPLVDDLFHDLGLQYAERPAHGTGARYIYREHPRRWPLAVSENVRLAKGLSRVLGRKYLPQSVASGLIANADGLTAREWVSQMFGPAAFDYLIGPALQGVMGTDDVAADSFIDYVRGAMAGRRNSRHHEKSDRRAKRGTVAPKQGMGEMVAALAARIEQFGGTIRLNSGSEIQSSGTTVLAVPAYTAAKILRTQLPEVSEQLAKVEYLPMTSVTAEFSFQNDREKIARGFGCLFPKNENFDALGVLFPNSIFAQGNRSQNDLSQDNRSVERWLFRSREPADADATIRRIVSDRSRLFKAASPNPEKFEITHWAQALPHYNLNLAQTLKAMRNFAEPIVDNSGARVYLTGNYLGQIGLGRILARNFSLARQIAAETLK